LSTIPVRQVAKIEVIRGGGAARFGTDAVGGVILITTRQAGSGLHGDASLSAGGQSTRGGDVSVSGASDRGSALLTYSRLSSQNDFEFDVTPPPGRDGVSQTYSFTRRNADFAEDSGLFRGSLNLGQSSRLDTTVDLYQKRGGQPGTTLGRGPRN